MVRDHSPPANLFTEYPARGLAFAPVLAQLDRLLDDALISQQVRADLAPRAPLTTRRGRAATPVEVGLRMLVVKRLYRWRDAETAHFVHASKHVFVIFIPSVILIWNAVMFILRCY